MEKLLRNTLFSETKRPLRQFLKQLCLKLPKESSVYMVGGLVRDILLNITEGKDIDLMVDLCSAEDIINILIALKKSNYLQSFQKVGKSFPVFKIKIYQFDEDIDLALARTEVSTGPGHTDFEIDAERISARQDGERRDFTVNALFIKFFTSDKHILDFELIDYFNGLEDLKNRKIRAVGDSLLRMKEDPLRILRAYRFCNQKNFTIDRRLFEVIRNNASKLLPSISFDRVQAEVIKTVQANPRKAIQDYLECDILNICFPELSCFFPQQTPNFFPTNKLKSDKQAFPLLLCPWLELKAFKVTFEEFKVLEKRLKHFHIPYAKEIKAILSGLIRLGNRYKTNYPDALQEKILTSHCGEEIFWLYTQFQRRFQFPPFSDLLNLPEKIDGRTIIQWGIKAESCFEDVVMRVRQFQIDGISDIAELRNKILMELSLSGDCV